MIFVVGTGRCGTTWAAQVLGGHHEPFIEASVPLAQAFSAGVMDRDDTAGMLKLLTDYRGVVADFKLSELIVPLVDVYPDARFLWLVRDRADTVASMMRMKWFDKSDDDAWPFMLWRWHPGQAQIETNYPGHRTTAPLVGEATWKEWVSWSQERRCDWWWRWCNRRIEWGLGQTGARWVRARLERLTPEILAGLAAELGSESPPD